MERLLFALESEGKKLAKDPISHLYIIAMGDSAIKKGSEILNMCRMGGLISEMDYSNKSLKAQFKQADKLNPMFTVIIGEDEIANGNVNIKNNSTKTQETINIDSVYNYIYNYLINNSSCGHCKK